MTGREINGRDIIRALNGRFVMIPGTRPRNECRMKCGRPMEYKGACPECIEKALRRVERVKS